MNNKIFLGLCLMLASMNATVSQTLVVDGLAASPSKGVFAGGYSIAYGAANTLQFGSNGPGEMIASKRTGTGGLYGIDFYTNATKRVSINNSGYVAIGLSTSTSDPDAQYPLHVNGIIAVDLPGTGPWAGNANAGKLTSNTHLKLHADYDGSGDGDLEFWTGSATVGVSNLLKKSMLIKTNGLVGIGVGVVPSGKLTVMSSGVDEGIRLTDNSNSNITMQVSGGGSGFSAISFNGYYKSGTGDYFYNSSKTLWRMSVDQRNTSDNFTIGRIGASNPGIALYVNESFNMGIRNNDPKTGFHVTANSIFEDNTAAVALTPATLVYSTSGALGIGALGGSTGYSWLQSKTGTPLLLNPLGVANTGPNGKSIEYVGIGFKPSDISYVPQGYLLAVKGNVICEALKIKYSGNWSDFVFDKNYKLAALSEVETYISENKHLPGIPSASEVKEEGFETAEMSAKLLQKIEELTLYMIEQKKESEAIKAEVKLLREENLSLKQQLTK